MQAAARPRARRRAGRGRDGRGRQRPGRAGVRRLVVAGGETAGAVVDALGVKALKIGPPIDPGVPWTVSLGEPRAAAGAQVGQFRRARLLHQSVRARAMSRRAALREEIAAFGELLTGQGLAHGSTGNISVRLEDGWLITPTNSRLGRLDPARIAKLDAAGRHVDGDPPSKEAFLHRCVYEMRPSARAIVHLHSTHSVAVSCLAGIDPDDVLPPLTAYYVMRSASCR